MENLLNYLKSLIRNQHLCKYKSSTLQKYSLLFSFALLSTFLANGQLEQPDTIKQLIKEKEYFKKKNLEEQNLNLPKE